jgi:hypothetical protein
MHSNGLHYQCCGSVFTLNSRGLYGAYMQAIRSGHPDESSGVKGAGCGGGGGRALLEDGREICK